MNNWQAWLKGLIAATVSSAANTITVMVVDPSVFNFENWPKLLQVAGISAAVGASLYLKQSPVPNWMPKPQEPPKS